MSVVRNKTLSLVGMGVIATVLWTPTLSANNTFTSTAVIAVGVQQTDPLVVLKLPDIEFEQTLVEVIVPEPILLPVRSSSNKAAVLTPVEPKAAKQDPSSELLTMNEELSNEQVSAALLAKFNRALSATSEDDNIPTHTVAESYNAVPIKDLPANLRAQVPDISYSSHVYSSKTQNRSVRLNNRDLREGSWLTDDIEVLEILQNEVIMRVGAQSFSLQALSDWSA